MTVSRWTGREVSALRTAMRPRHTQMQFAERIGCTVDAVGKWERLGAEITLRPKYADCMDTQLSRLSADEQAAFRAALDGNVSVAGLDADEIRQPDLVAPTVADDLMALTRRSFIRGVGAATVSSASAQAAVSLSIAEGLRSVSTAYRSAYRTAPARQLLASAHAHVELVLSLHPEDQNPLVRDHLLLTAGEMAALAGTILGLDLDRWGDADPYYTFAATAANQTGNHELGSVVMACRAFHAAYGTHDLAAGRDFAEQAVRLAERGGCSVTRGWTMAVASERFADTGDAMASQHHLDGAYAALERPFDERQWSGIGSFDIAKLTAYQGGNFRRLGEPDRAVRVLDDALTQLDPSLRRHRATALVDRAEAHRDAGRIDAACADTREALSLVMETQHAGTLQRAEAIARVARRAGAAEADDVWSDLLCAKAKAMVA